MLYAFNYTTTELSHKEDILRYTAGAMAINNVTAKMTTVDLDFFVIKISFWFV